MTNTHTSVASSAENQENRVTSPAAVSAPAAPIAPSTSRLTKEAGDQFDLLELTLQELGIKLATDSATAFFKQDQATSELKLAQSRGMLVVVEMLRLIRSDIEAYLAVEDAESAGHFPWQSVMRGVFRELTPQEIVLANTLLKNEEEKQRLLARKHTARGGQAADKAGSSTVGGAVNGAGTGSPAAAQRSGSGFAKMDNDDPAAARNNWQSRAPAGSYHTGAQLRDYFLMAALDLPQHKGSMEQIVQNIGKLIEADKGALLPRDMDLIPSSRKPRLHDQAIVCRNEFMVAQANGTNPDGRPEPYLKRVDERDRHSGWYLTPTGIEEAKRLQQERTARIAREMADEARRGADARSELPLLDEHGNPVPEPDHSRNGRRELAASR